MKKKTLIQCIREDLRPWRKPVVSAIAGACIGSRFGIVSGPLLAISGTIPGVLIGAAIGFRNNKLD